MRQPKHAPRPAHSASWCALRNRRSVNQIVRVAAGPASGLTGASGRNYDLRPDAGSQDSTNTTGPHADPSLLHGDVFLRACQHDDNRRKHHLLGGHSPDVGIDPGAHVDQ